MSPQVRPTSVMNVSGSVTNLRAKLSPKKRPGGPGGKWRDICPRLIAERRLDVKLLAGAARLIVLDHRTVPEPEVPDLHVEIGIEYVGADEIKLIADVRPLVGFSERLAGDDIERVVAV